MYLSFCYGPKLAVSIGPTVLRTTHGKEGSRRRCGNRQFHLPGSDGRAGHPQQMKVRIGGSGRCGGMGPGDYNAESLERTPIVRRFVVAGTRSCFLNDTFREDTELLSIAYGQLIAT